MKIRNAPYAHCAACAKPIYNGNAVVSLCHSIEQRDCTPSHPDGVITIVASEALLILCGSCGNAFGAERARDTIQAALTQPQFIRN